MKVITQYEIENLFFPVGCYNYYVSEWRSVDGGENFCYCGYGKYCKTLAEAEQYAKSKEVPA